MFNKELKPFAYLINVTKDFIQIFNFEAHKNIYFGIKHPLNGILIFDLKNVYNGHMESDKYNGYVLFDKSNSWIGTVK